MSDTLSVILMQDLRSNWEQYTKKGFSQIDVIKLIIHDAKNFWMGGMMSQHQWAVLETIGYFYKQEDESKFVALTSAIEILVNPGQAMQNLLHLDEDDMKERTRLNEKWNPSDNPLMPFKDWNDLWLKKFDRPTLSEDSS